MQCCCPKSTSSRSCIPSRCVTSCCPVRVRVSVRVHAVYAVCMLYMLCMVCWCVQHVHVAVCTCVSCHVCVMCVLQKYAEDVLKFNVKELMTTSHSLARLPHGAFWQILQRREGNTQIMCMFVCMVCAVFAHKCKYFFRCIHDPPARLPQASRRRQERFSRFLSAMKQ